MKVLHYHFGKDGGAEKFFVHLVNGLAQRGVEQKVIIRPERPWKQNLHSSIEVAFESHFRIASFDRILLPLKANALVRRWKPDVVLAWMVRAAKLVPANPAPLRLVRLGDYAKSLKKFANVDTLVCNTPDIASEARKLGWTRGAEVISNFTSLEQVAPIERSAVNTPKDAFVISAMGRLVDYKGFDVLIRAMAALPGAYLWLAGNGVEEDNLRSLAAQTGVADRVRFLGWLADTRPYVAASDCFVMPSRHEPLGNVILEAWAQERPVVSSRSEGPTWFVKDGENGLLVDIGDVDGLAAAVAKIRDDKALAKKLVSNGSKTLAQQFSQKAVLDAYMELFSSRGKRTD